MAAINFVKGEQYYTAEFQINGPVNVHIERAEAGALYFRQRSIDHGSYDLINGANWNNRGDLTIDTAIQGVVYPMWIKIESTSEPTLAEMVEGEQSGGGAGTADSGDWHYFDVSALEPLSKCNVLQIGMLHKLQGENMESSLGSSVITPAGLGYMIPTDAIEHVKAVATDFTQKIQFAEQITTVGEYITTAPWYGQVPEITKEEFYNLEA